MTPQERIDLSRFFDGEFYRWVHPGAAQDDDAALQHFLDVGCSRLWDPSPNVQLRALCEHWGMVDRPRAAYERLCAHGPGGAPGVYATRDELTTAQTAFRRAIGRGQIARRVQTARRRRNLVFVQLSDGRRVAPWMDRAHRSFDVWANFYTPQSFDPTCGDWVSAQTGTKFTAVASFHEHFASYDHVWLLDDDIEISALQIEAGLRAMEVSGADLAQPSLSADSDCAWPALRTRQGSRWRDVNAAEIMMPIYSRRLGARAFPSFASSISGFGLDLLSGALARELGGRVLVFDEIVARHLKAIDQAGGAYYAFLRQHNINPMAELWSVLRDNGLEIAGISDRPTARMAAG